MTEPVGQSPEHIHEWERGGHMAAAFGVDGRRLHCAICGVPRPMTEPVGQSPTCKVCGNGKGYWQHTLNNTDYHQFRATVRPPGDDARMEEALRWIMETPMHRDECPWCHARPGDEHHDERPAYVAHRALR